MTFPLRAPVIAGNWKMHKGPEAAAAFCHAFFERFRGPDGPTLLLFPPAVSIPAVRAALDGLPDRHEVAVGVQNVHWEAEGAFTGEISAPMAVEAGAEVALIGHSERRHVFGEADDDVRRKVTAALAAGLAPLVCVGETLEERRAGRVDDVILRQLDAALDGLGEAAADGASRLTLAYEPVWAIGTGETATPEDAAAAHATLRGRLVKRLGKNAARDVPILYGGSVKPDNAAELLRAPDVDGVLVGGASLDPDAFAAIATAAP
ncbi:MAG: triose-phosphate isomerase [Longimicrobiales bacterium]